MKRSKKHMPSPYRFEIHRTDKGTYCVVQIMKGLHYPLPQTEHPSLEVAHEWLRLYQAMARRH